MQRERPGERPERAHTPDEDRDRATTTEGQSAPRRSLPERLVDRTDNEVIQQGLRYYAQRGPLRSLATVGEVAVRGLTGSNLEGYLDRHSIYREELLWMAGDRVWYYDAPETVEIGEPLSDGPIPDGFREGVGPFHRDQPYVCELPDVRIVGPTANPRASDGRYVRDAQGLAQSQMLQSVLAERLAAPLGHRRPPSERLETAVLFTNLWTDNYFHFILDFLPRLRGVEEYERRTGVRPTLVVGANISSRQYEYLERMGFGREDCYEYDGRGLAVDTLVVPYGVRYKRSLIEWVRDRLLASVGPDDGARTFPSRVYLSRDDALCRRVRNQAELLAALEARGFEKVILSETSVADQIRIFANAEVVLGPHGAGFSNVLYNPDVSVVELYGTKEGPSTFHLAGVLGQRYACLRCEDVGEDLVVDVDRVTGLLDRVESERAARSGA